MFNRLNPHTLVLQLTVLGCQGWSVSNILDGVDMKFIGYMRMQWYIC